MQTFCMLYTHEYLYAQGVSKKNVLKLFCLLNVVEPNSACCRHNVNKSGGGIELVIDETFCSKMPF